MGEGRCANPINKCQWVHKVSRRRESCYDHLHLTHIPPPCSPLNHAQNIVGLTKVSIDSESTTSTRRLDQCNEIMRDNDNVFFWQTVCFKFHTANTRAIRAKKQAMARVLALLLLFAAAHGLPVKLTPFEGDSTKPNGHNGCRVAATSFEKGGENMACPSQSPLTLG